MDSRRRGWVKNQGPNREMAGDIIMSRQKPDTGGMIYQFCDLSSAMLIPYMHELARIDEALSLQRHSQRLRRIQEFWLSYPLTEAEWDLLGHELIGLANELSLSRDEAKAEAFVRLTGLATLRDRLERRNPSAFLSQAVAIQARFGDRLGRLDGILDQNSRERAEWLNHTVVPDYRQAIRFFTDRLKKYPRIDRTAVVGLKQPGQLILVKPGSQIVGQLGYEIKLRGNKVGAASKDLIDNTVAAFEFEASPGRFLRAFNFLAARPVGQLSADPVVEAAYFKPLVEDARRELAAHGLGYAPGRFFDHLIDLADQIRVALTLATPESMTEARSLAIALRHEYQYRTSELEAWYDHTLNLAP